MKVVEPTFLGLAKSSESLTELLLELFFSKESQFLKLTFSNVEFHLFLIALSVLNRIKILNKNYNTFQAIS